MLGLETFLHISRWSEPTLLALLVFFGEALLLVAFLSFEHCFSEKILLQTMSLPWAISSVLGQTEVSILPSGVRSVQKLWVSLWSVPISLRTWSLCSLFFSLQYSLKAFIKSLKQVYHTMTEAAPSLLRLFAEQAHVTFSAFLPVC